MLDRASRVQKIEEGCSVKTLPFNNFFTTALKIDRKIISFDKSYDSVPGLIRIHPETI